MRATYFFLSLLILSGCASTATPPPGYSGPLPSGAAQGAVHSLSGKSFKDDSGAAWTVGGFMVGPSGPFVTVSQGATQQNIPLETDGDVADFYLRVTGTPHATLRGVTSANYAKARK